MHIQDVPVRVDGSFAPPGREREQRDRLTRVALARRLARSTRGYIPTPRWGVSIRSLAGQALDAIQREDGVVDASLVGFD